jgi:hypothetical protein
MHKTIDLSPQSLTNLRAVATNPSDSAGAADATAKTANNTQNRFIFVFFFIFLLQRSLD